MKPGKLPHHLLAELLARLPRHDPRVVVGPGVGEDAAVVDLGDRLLVATTDPITFATDLIGWYAVHINANDIAAMGAAPRWFLATVLLPETAEESQTRAIFDQIAESCQEVGAAPIGGHTEITIGLDRPIVAACMLGEADRGKLLTTAGARPGDSLVLAGSIAVEGTAILAREAPEALRAKGIPQKSVDRARELLFDPGLSILPAARPAADLQGVTAMHDPTEGGLATGLRELAIASGVGLEIQEDRLPVLPLTREICTALALNPLGLIASGSLLIAVRAEACQPLLNRLAEAGIQAARIGRALPEEEGLWLVSAGGRQPLPEFDRDEMARFFERR